MKTDRRTCIECGQIINRNAKAETVLCSNCKRWGKEIGIEALREAITARKATAK